ncbi:cytochrome c biogenesis protein CcsA [bacterium]|nr:cytochrome c biogenesis protein CcsA [bacterium]
MERLIHFIEILLPLGYLVGVNLYGVAFVNPGHVLAQPARPALEITLLLHLAYLVIVAAHFQRIPMVSIFEVLSCLAFAVAAVYLYLERRVAEKSVGLFILALAFLFQLLSSGFVEHPKATPPLLAGYAVALHVASVLVSYAAFTVSAVFALMYLMLYHEIRQHRFGLIYSRMPSLDVMASFCAHGAQVGFVFLSLAMVAGSFRAHAELDYAWYHDPKVLSVILIWLVYGALVSQILAGKWKGRRIAYLSLAGYGITIASMLTINFVSQFHGFQ